MTHIDVAKFKKINEEISSDTLMSVLGLFRERLPCAENFWRYKRNYDQLMTNQSSGPARPNSARAVVDPLMEDESGG